SDCAAVNGALPDLLSPYRGLTQRGTRRILRMEPPRSSGVARRAGGARLSVRVAKGGRSAAAEPQPADGRPGAGVSATAAAAEALAEDRICYGAAEPD